MHPAKYRKWSTVNGRSAAIVSRRGLPLSQVSAAASMGRFASMRSAILLRIFARSVVDVLPQAAFALCAASSANSTSAAEDRATSQKTLPVTGVVLTIIKSQRGKHPIWVFPYHGRRIERMNNNGWQQAR